MAAFDSIDGFGGGYFSSPLKQNGPTARKIHQIIASNRALFHLPFGLECVER